MIYQGVDDECLPVVPKPSLQQYDNYQIYDLICLDILTERFSENVVVDTQKQEHKSFLAIQAYSTNIIETDFILIARTYK